jgi:hypothetical protein
VANSTSMPSPMVLMTRPLMQWAQRFPSDPLDDRPWNNAVVDAQRIGRNLRCFSMGDLAPEAAAAEWQVRHGGIRLAAGSIVWPQSTRLPQAS